MSAQRLAHLEPTQFGPEEPEAPQSSATAYLAGEVVADRYRLVRELGRGGMGVVWEARSLALGVDVALKLLRMRGSETEMASRMAREAHAAARLSHPALVRVFDFGTTNRGHPFLVMELAQGETLSNVLVREGRMGAIRAVQMLLPVADGLRCAHDKGIVHRDVKPDNLFIAKDSFGRLQPKLIDFGIARVRQPLVEHRLTQEGVVMGSPAYMSPEQALGDDGIDGRSDLWAMCVMLYEMICARMPFQNKNYNALMQAILHQEPVPSHSIGAGDADLWAVIAKGLLKAPQARYANATELGGALALWLHRHGVKEDICGNSIRALWLHPSAPRIGQDAVEIQISPNSVVQTETRMRVVATGAAQANPALPWKNALSRLRAPRSVWMGILIVVGLFAWVWAATATMLHGRAEAAPLPPAAQGRASPQTSTDSPAGISELSPSATAGARAGRAPEAATSDPPNPVDSRATGTTGARATTSQKPPPTREVRTTPRAEQKKGAVRDFGF